MSLPGFRPRCRMSKEFRSFIKMSTTQDSLEQYSGLLVPFSFNAGFVCLSYAISLIGTGSTLELIRRRTSHKGVHNLYVCPRFTDRQFLKLTGSGIECCYSVRPFLWVGLRYGPWYENGPPPSCF